MEATVGTIGRDAQGRWTAGVSGNPAGKAAGTRNRATVLREILDSGDDAALVRQARDDALGGDSRTTRLMVERLFPKPRSRPVVLDLPDGWEALPPAARVAAVLDAAFRQLVTGDITPDEALQMVRIAEQSTRLLERAAAAAEAEATLLAEIAALREREAAARGAGPDAPASRRRTAPPPPTVAPASHLHPACKSGRSAAAAVGPARPGMAPPHAVDALHPACIAGDAAAPPRQAA